MKRLLTFVLLAFLAGSPVFAMAGAAPIQDEEQGGEEAPDPQALQKEFNDKFQEGIDALTSGEHDKGIAAFKRCLVLIPEEATLAYNLACGYSLKGEVDTGMEWFETSAKWGFGDDPKNIEHAGTDTDLANLQADERFAGIVQYMKDRPKMMEAYWKTPLIHVPESLKDVEKVPVLVVLHDMGETKQEVMDRGWKALCDELGMALVVPGGMHPDGADFSKGALWFKSMQDYISRYWTYEKPITVGFDALKETGKKLERGQVYMVGVGQGGFVGFTAAVRAPSLYKGVISFDSLMALELIGKKGPKAGAAGFKAALYVSDTMFGVPPAQIGEACAAQSPALEAWKIGGPIERMEKTDKVHEARIALVKKKVTEWRQPVPEEPEPAEAGSPK